MEPDLNEEEIEQIRATRSRTLSAQQRRHSALPMRWRFKHSSRWMAHVMASEFSLLAFLILLVMTFSGKWLNPSKSRFYRRHPQNITNKIYTSIHTMSTGLLYVCLSKSCSDHDTDSFKLWTMHPFLGVAKISFTLALGLGFALTAWLHLPYLSHQLKMPFYGLIGIILSFCEVTSTLVTLLLFPVDLWIYELKRDISVPIGWSYFIGWLVLILHFSCGLLCYLNYKNFWSLISNSSSSIVSSKHREGSLQCSLQSARLEEDTQDPSNSKDCQV
ncbi:outer dense fiber protein 4 [Psammomys obesus]|uniref:outer dense fiber protein 4 n=1 Tax=Psammomys obesus TaxID=48139 RepID=UPI0024530DEC|nr:outer dense fiber protein 4 [Psammomys obesus]